MANDDFTQDGSVNLRGLPVLASRTGKWKACSFIVGYEVFERMAFYGVSSNLVVYLTTRLRQDTVTSVRNVNFWTAAVWLTPIVGAFISDSYFGRFWTFTISSILYVLGMGLLTMAVSVKTLRPDCSSGTCAKASPSQTAFFYTALYVMALGAGGTKPNIPTFGADQFDEFNAVEKKVKASFFNWWMFCSYSGGLIATLGLVYVQENVGWGAGYGIPTAGLVASLVVFYIGTPYYRHKVKKTKDPAKGVVQVFAAALRNRQEALPADPGELHEMELQYYVMTGKRRVHHTKGLRFLDKAAVKKQEGDEPPCTVTQVEEAKLLVRMAVLWLTTLVPSTIWAQVNTLFVKQGTTLDRHLGGGSYKIPAASLSSFITITILIFFPIYDKFLVPFLRRRTGNTRGISLLQRLGVGYVLTVLVTLVAFLVELRRRRVIHRTLHSEAVPPPPNAEVPMSIFWLLPQYVLLGIADVFSTVGLLEFFYDQSPEDMQSIGTTFYTSSIGTGDLVNSFLVTVVDKITKKSSDGSSWIGKDLNRSHLDYFYALLMTISAVNLAAFLWASTWYVYKKETLEAQVLDEVKAVISNNVKDIELPIMNKTKNSPGSPGV